MNADEVPNYDWCPRCGEGGLEHLKTYSHCVSCLGIFDRQAKNNSCSNVVSIKNVRRLAGNKNSKCDGEILEFPYGA